VRPDGDIELGDAGQHFRVAPCSACGSRVLKPDVVFFGDSVPKERVERCAERQMPARLLYGVARFARKFACSAAFYMSSSMLRLSSAVL
jgi:hypothetical protein